MLSYSLKLYFLFFFCFFFFNDTATTEIYTLSLHDALPIFIGHMQHNLRDPSRDKTHGRVYRVTYEGRPLSKHVKIAGEPIEKLLDLLKEPESRVRYRAKIELSGRDTREVMLALDRWIAGLDKTDKD